MTRPALVLTNYPLSTGFKSRIERHLGFVPGYLNVSELRQVPIPRLFLRMLSLRAPRVLIAVEDESSRAATPILGLLAAFVRAPRLAVIDFDLNEVPFGRFAALRAAVGVAVESVKAAGALMLAGRDVRRLSTASRVEGAVERYRNLAYLNCNMYIGIKAGGSVGHISGVANAFMDLGFTLQFFSVAGRLLVDGRAKYVPLAPPRTLAMPLEATHYRFDRLLDKRLTTELRRCPPDLIYQRISLGNYAGVRLARKLGVPLVVEYNGSEAWVAKNWGRPLRFHELAVATEELALRSADVVVTVSDVLGTELADRGIDRSRIVVYPNCIDPKMFDPARFSVLDRAEVRHGLGFERDDLVATFVGTFGQWHGVDVLAEAIRHLVDRDHEFLDRYRLRFALVGDGAKMPIVRATLGAVGASKYVRLAGLVPQTEAPRYLAASDLLLSPHVGNQDGSAFFGSPTKLFEYMAMGKAIVASDLDQIGQVLRPAIALPGAGAAPVGQPEKALAVLVPPGDTGSLIAAIRFCCENPAVRQLLGQNARVEALAKYTWHHHVKAILARLEAVRPARAGGGRR